MWKKAVKIFFVMLGIAIIWVVYFASIEKLPEYAKYIMLIPAIIGTIIFSVGFYFSHAKVSE